MEAPVRYLWGPLTAFGLFTAAITGALDQASKLWLLKVFDLANNCLLYTSDAADE